MSVFRYQKSGKLLRQLRLILAQMVKGEMGMRVEVWRMAMMMCDLALP